MTKIKVPRTGKLPALRTKNFLDDNLYVILSFLVPFLLMAVAFASENVAPFGILKTMYESVLYHIGNLFPSLGITVTPNVEKPWGTEQMLVIDLWHQYYPFLYDLHEKLQEGSSLFWTWSVGMGSNFIAMMSYYLLSPLNFISVIIPDGALVGYLCVATVIKISCAGMFTAICLRMLFKRNDLSLVMFSLMFALCSFNMGYYWCVIWMDSVALLPLVVAGTVALLRDGKYKLFTISLALSVIFNYYIGLFICIAVFLTAIGYTVSRWHSLKKSLKDMLRTVTCSGIALLMTTPITVPAYLALQNCYKSASGMPENFAINVGTVDSAIVNATEPGMSNFVERFQEASGGVLDAFLQIISNIISFVVPTSKEGLPNIACGMLCVILLGVFFCSRKIKLGEKLFCCTTLLFLIASFIFRQLDYMWHGFHFPNMLPYRFSFLVSFLLIYMAYRAYMLLRYSSYIDVIIATLLLVLILLPSIFTLLDTLETPLLDPAVVSKEAVIGSLVFSVIMIILLILFTLRIMPRRILTMALCIVVCVEMCACAVIGVNSVGSTTTTGYPREAPHMERMIDYIEMREDANTDIFRTEVTGTQSLNDGALNGYNGISVFNSMANVNITKYVEHLGLAGWQAGNRYTYYESSPVTNTILNLKYVIARDGVAQSDYLNQVNYSGPVSLFENTEYIPMGFMTNSDLKYLSIDDSVVNPFENQIEFWKLATGIEEPLYNLISVDSAAHTPSENFTVSRPQSQQGMYTAYTTDSTITPSTKFNYDLDEDAFVCVYFYVGGAESSGQIKVTPSGGAESIIRSSLNVKQPFITCVGRYKAGDTVSLCCQLKTGANCSIRAFCYALDEDVFRAGLDKLSESVLEATKVTDTSIEGTINVKEEGYFYTSIPYEAGWSAYVDGKKVKMDPVGDAMCGFILSEGEHTVKLTYTPDGFVIGMLGFSFALVLFVLICVCTSKRFRNSKFFMVRFIVWLFDPAVKDKSAGDAQDGPDDDPDDPDGTDAPDGEAPEGAQDETDEETEVSVVRKYPEAIEPAELEFKVMDVIGASDIPLTGELINKKLSAQYEIDEDVLADTLDKLEAKGLVKFVKQNGVTGYVCILDKEESGWFAKLNSLIKGEYSMWILGGVVLMLLALCCLVPYLTKTVTEDAANTASTADVKINYGLMIPLAIGAVVDFIMAFVVNMHRSSLLRDCTGIIKYTDSVVPIIVSVATLNVPALLFDLKCGDYVKKGKAKLDKIRSVQGTGRPKKKK